MVHARTSAPKVGPPVPGGRYRAHPRTHVLRLLWFQFLKNPSPSQSPSQLQSIRAHPRPSVVKKQSPPQNPRFVPFAPFVVPIHTEAPANSKAFVLQPSHEWSRLLRLNQAKTRAYDSVSTHSATSLAEVASLCLNSIPPRHTKAPYVLFKPESIDPDAQLPFKKP